MCFPTLKQCGTYKLFWQAIEAATVKVPPADPTKEISGTRTEQRVKMNRMRLRIAQRLKEAQNVNAMLTTFNELDMRYLNHTIFHYFIDYSCVIYLVFVFPSLFYISGIMEFRKLNQDAFQKKHGIKLGFMSAFVKAAAYALQEQPVINAVIDGNEIIYRDYVDISVAVATPKVAFLFSCSALYFIGNLFFFFIFPSCFFCRDWWFQFFAMWSP